jgi:hypothetical protein
MARLVIERIAEGHSAASGDAAPRTADPPTVAAIRLVFGVGSGPGDAPTAATWKPAYTLSIPVFSLGGLDADGVYEFDAADLLRRLQERALRRRWGLRVELELHQGADTVAVADLCVDAPEGVTLEVQGRTRTGTVSAGGGRSVLVASDVVTDPGRVAGLGGSYDLRLDGGAQGVTSSVRPVKLRLTNYEFEG